MQVEIGPRYGYFPKPSKCILLAKPERIELVHEIFGGTGIDIQLDGSKDVDRTKKSGVEIITTEQGI